MVAAAYVVERRHHRGREVVDISVKVGFSRPLPRPPRPWAKGGRFIKPDPREPAMMVEAEGSWITWT